MKLGSLFDGIGGFPLSATLHGIEPVWASEIEKFPIEVTKIRFPNMKHLGDITQISGAEIEPVDIITFGSPCQRLSVAGRHDGFGITFTCEGTKDKPHDTYIKKVRANDKYQYIYTDTCGECGVELTETNESALFFHAIRIIGEMRNATANEYPRFIIWENVPGAFSSNGGQDFRSVLEEITEAEIPMPASGKWATAGMVRVGERSAAWRVLDAQYWGVPQRRKRIFLVADFAGQRAGEILFEQQGLPWNFTPCGSPWQRTAGDAQKCTGTSGNSVTCLNDQGGGIMSVSENVTATLRALEHGHQPCVMQSSGFCTEHSSKSRGVGYEKEKSPTLRAGVVPGVVMSFEPGAVSRIGGHTDENLSGSLRANMGDNQTAVAIENHPTDGRCKIETDGKVQKIPTYSAITGQQTYTSSSFAQYVEGVGTLKASGGDLGGGSETLVCSYAVRRLTPTECERLQGFPDNWTDIPGASDTGRYKALGNSVAIPCVSWIIGRIAESVRMP